MNVFREAVGHPAFATTARASPPPGSRGRRGSFALEKSMRSVAHRETSALPARRGVLVASSLGMVLCCGGCWSSEVKARFEWDVSCPVSRVEARAREDLHTTNFACWSMGHGTENYCKDPPPEVRDDPGRLAFWRAQMARDLAKTDRGPIYEVWGCGEHRFYVRIPVFAEVGRWERIGGDR
jgi:hypothetical protein